jgi:leader peptidase (prepilin peptidase) / N-methyltransferase
MNSIQNLPYLIQAFVAGIFGLIVGSFLNVVIYRIPRGESVSYPGSHCGSCGKPVKPYDNIPVLSYLILRGKCRACKSGYSAIYPAVEFLVGVLFFLVAYTSGITTLNIFRMIFVAIIVVLIFIDARHQLLPNIITYPALLFSIASITFASHLWSARLLEGLRQSLPLNLAAWGGAIGIALAVPVFFAIDRLDNALFGKYFEWEEVEESDEDKHIEENYEKRGKKVEWFSLFAGFALAIGWIIYSYSQPESVAHITLINSLIGAIVGGGLIWLLRTFYFYARGIEGMGLGDVKMMAFVGAFLGWQASILILMLGSLLGSFVGVAMAMKSGGGMKVRLAFGVFLGAAAILSLFAGRAIIDSYLGMMQK